MSVVRRGKPEDGPILARLHSQSFESGWPEADFATYLRSDQTTDQVWVLDDPPVGFIVVRYLVDEAEILTLAVESAGRRQGRGAALLRAVCEALSQLGVGRLFLEVAVDNEAAIGLYRRHGFVDQGVRRAYYQRRGGERVDALVMAYDLPAAH